MVDVAGEVAATVSIDINLLIKHLEDSAGILNLVVIAIPQLSRVNADKLPLSVYPLMILIHQIFWRFKLRFLCATMCNMLLDSF